MGSSSNMNFVESAVLSNCGRIGQEMTGKKKTRCLADLVEDLLLDKERGGFLKVFPEAEKESRKMEFIVGSFQIKLKVPELVVETE